jgi:hypothetical protein
MPFSRTRDEMVANGYKFSNHSRCKGCMVEIEWWETPRGKKMPFLLMPEGTSPAKTHFADCPDADLFRKPASK